jgi:Flp pilus assembly protein TadG
MDENMNKPLEENTRQVVRAGRRRRERGQAFTEMALTLMFLLVLLSVVVDLGWAFYTLVTLRDAAQEAAAYGAMCPKKDDGTANTDSIRQRLIFSSTAPIDLRTVPSSDVDIQVWFTALANTDPSTAIDLAPVTTPVMGGNVVVRVTLQHQIVTPFVGAFIGRQQYPLTVQVADTVMRSKWLAQCAFR